MTRMAVSCRARLYGYFRSKQPCGRVNGRSTWWTTLTQHGQTPFHNEIVGGEQHRSTEYSLVVHDFPKFQAYTSEKQNLSCCFFFPLLIHYRGRQQTLGQWTFSVRVSKCVLIWRGVEAREEKKNSSHSCGRYSAQLWPKESNTETLRMREKKENGCLPGPFSLFIAPLFCLPFDLFYIDFFVTGLCVCVVVGAFTIEERRPSREWPLGSRTTRSSSINNGLARRVHETSRNRPSVILFFFFFPSPPFPPPYTPSWDDFLFIHSKRSMQR